MAYLKCQKCNYLESYVPVSVSPEIQELEAQMCPNCATELMYRCRNCAIIDVPYRFKNRCNHCGDSLIRK